VWLESDKARELDAEECWALLREHDFGRLAISAPKRVEIFPINYYAGAGYIVFRTAPGTKLLELTMSGYVALEIDGHTDEEAWSVVVKGDAMSMDTPSEIAGANSLPLRPWVDSPHHTWIRIEPTKVTGRKYQRSHRLDPAE
jgi:nitroimidazol reductase NimA-like FMN-containing flavoprotein (pyridoxamine 5'-phosphate oxidase superfamily)